MPRAERPSAAAGAGAGVGTGAGAEPAGKAEAKAEPGTRARADVKAVVKAVVKAKATVPAETEGSGLAGATAPGPKSRRHPVTTTGTFPPEGAAPAAGRGQPIPVRQWPIVIVLTMVGVGLAVTALNQFRPGVVTIGVALLLGCVLRIVLPEVGMLAVRSRFTDIAVMGVLGTAIILLALASEPDPVITLPFVNEIAGWVGRGGG